MRRLFLRSLAVALAEIAALLLLGELAARWTRVDERLLWPLLYFQVSHLEVHEARSDPGILYGLRPGAAALVAGRRISVNSFGMRDRPRRREKPAGVFRIVCLGGSNTYGAAVDDGETYPAFLERLLERDHPGRFEVWNAGVPAHTLAQNAASAEEILRLYQPDLLIFQVHNLGRRPFLMGERRMDYFREDPTLFLENLPWLPFSDANINLALLRRSALWRTFVCLANRLSRSPVPENHLYNTRGRDFWRLQRLWLNHGGRVRFVILDAVESLAPDFGLPRIALEADLPRGAGEEYRDIHPPAPVYRWYARVIAARLSALGLLDRSLPPSPPPAVPAALRREGLPGWRAFCLLQARRHLQERDLDGAMTSLSQAEALGTEPDVELQRVRQAVREALASEKPGTN